MTVEFSILILGSVFALIVLTRLFYHKSFDQSDSPLCGQDNFVVQIDDLGQFWDPSVAATALETVRSLSKKTNVVVLVFVHGWNHSASPKSGNVVDFAKSLEDTRSQLTGHESSVYKKSRKNLTGTDDLTVIGIYIGWRGRSLPGWLNYLTFWGRKAAAERVGRGDLREFMFELNSIYRQTLVERLDGSIQTFMGLASFGHSFGGQVLYRAVQNELENELVAATADASNPDVKGEPPAPLLGVGDVVVLVNPALEAIQYERIDRLSRSLKYPKEQRPVMLVVSSAGDIPRQVLFPLGRILGSIFQSGFRGDQWAKWTRALGEYKEFRTHDLDVLTEVGVAPEFDANLYVTDPCKIALYDLTSVPAISNVRLEPKNPDVPNTPFLVAYASLSIVRNHHDIFEEVLRQFLNDYIALAQGKSIIWSNPNISC